MSAFDPLRTLQGSAKPARMDIPIRLEMVGFLALVGTASAAMPPSRTVQGPLLLCFKYSTFQLADGERVTDFSGAGEDMSITIEGSSGTFRVSEGEIWAEPKRPGRAMFMRDGTAVYWHKRERKYAIYGLTSFSPDEARLVIWLSGDALRGGSHDESIYKRFEVREPKGAPCGYTFTYSW